MSFSLLFSCFFFFNDTATTEIYTLSLHDALPICPLFRSGSAPGRFACRCGRPCRSDRKSTRLNPSHITISYAVFCLKKKKKKKAERLLTKKKKKKSTYKKKHNRK